MEVPEGYELKTCGLCQGERVNPRSKLTCWMCGGEGMILWWKGEAEE